jgi:hypothetical protein
MSVFKRNASPEKNNIFQNGRYVKNRQTVHKVSAQSPSVPETSSNSCTENGCAGEEPMEEEVKALPASAAEKRKLFIFLRNVYQACWASTNANYFLEVFG